MSLWDDCATIPERTGVTPEHFLTEIVPAGRPIVLRGLVANWPIVAAARAGDAAFFAYLKRFETAEPIPTWFGDPRIEGRFGYTDDVSAFNHQRRAVPLGTLLDWLAAHGDNPQAPTAYAGGIPVPQVLPNLLPDIELPLLAERPERLVSLWLGGRSRTAAHWDLPQNVACVVAGRRRFTLMPTDQVANLYVGPLDVTPAGQSISLVDFERPDLERYPRFRDAVAAAQVATLEPGDAIFVPSLWWHHVRSLDTLGGLVNFWWREGQAELASPLFTLLHALTTLRPLPAAEREGWRALLNHYIFEDAGDPAAHLPDAAKGMLGPLTPELLARLNAIVAGPLKA